MGFPQFMNGLLYDSLQLDGLQFTIDMIPQVRLFQLNMLLSVTLIHVSDLVTQHLIGEREETLNRGEFRKTIVNHDQGIVHYVFCCFWNSVSRKNQQPRPQKGEDHFS